MKKRNLVKKALLPAVIAVVCSLVALTSVSYAWFTMGNTASVESIDVNVQAADGVQISADAKNWKSILPVADLEAQTSNQFPAGNILPMSSVGTIVNGKQEMFIGNVGEDGKTLVTTKQTEGDGNTNFIAFDLYVNLVAAKEFYLDAASSVVALTNASKNTEFAVRVSFIYLGTAAASADAPALAGDADTTAIIWEPNSDDHISEVSAVATGKLSYYGVKAANATGFDKNATNDDVNLGAVTTIDPDGSAYKLFDLGAGYTKIRVYIWLEGQDADCLNDISGGGFQVNLNFKTEDPAQNA